MIRFRDEQIIICCKKLLSKAKENSELSEALAEFLFGEDTHVNIDYLPVNYIFSFCRTLRIGHTNKEEHFLSEELNKKYYRIPEYLRNNKHLILDNLTLLLDIVLPVIEEEVAIAFEKKLYDCYEKDFQIRTESKNKTS